MFNVSNRTADVLTKRLEQAWSERHESSTDGQQISLEVFASATDPKVQGYALRNLGFFDYLNAAYQTALEKLLRGLELAHEIGDQILERDCINYAAAVYLSLGDLETAALYVQQTYDINLQLHDEAGLVSSLNNMGLVQHDLGHYENAKHSFTEALERSRVLADRTREGTTLINLAITLTALEDFENAILMFELSLYIFEDLGATHMIARNLSNLADAQRKLGLFADALLTIERAIVFCKQSNDRSTLVFNWHNAAQIHLGQGNTRVALQILETAKSEAEAINAKTHLYQIHQLFSEVYRNTQNWKAALEHADLHHQLEREVRNESSSKTAQAFSISRGLYKAQAEAERQHQKNLELADALAALERSDREKTNLLHQLRDTTLELQQQVIRDPLTKAYNRRYLEERINIEFSRAKREKRHLAVAMVDVDNFKSINDRFGHQVGDRVLQQIASLLSGGIRPSDTAARYGGEEFALLLPNLERNLASAVCERLRITIQNELWELLHPELHVTVSIGLATDTSVAVHEKLLHLADDKLYEAKRTGKNRVCV